MRGATRTCVVHNPHSLAVLFCVHSFCGLRREIAGGVLWMSAPNAANSVRRRGGIVAFLLPLLSFSSSFPVLHPICLCYIHALFPLIICLLATSNPPAPPNRKLTSLFPPSLPPSLTTRGSSLQSSARGSPSPAAPSHPNHAITPPSLTGRPEEGKEEGREDIAAAFLLIVVVVGGPSSLPPSLPPSSAFSWAMQMCMMACTQSRPY